MKAPTLNGAPVPSKAAATKRRLRTHDRSAARPPTSPTRPRAWTSPCTSPTKTPSSARSPRRCATPAIRFPAGLAVNPSQAAGLGACSEAQIGFLGEAEGAPGLLKARRKAAPTPPSSAPWKPPRRCWCSETKPTKSTAGPRRRPDARTAARLPLPRPALRQSLRLADRGLPRGRRPEDGHRRQARRRRRSSIPRAARSRHASTKTPSCRSKTSGCTSSAATAAPLITPPACGAYTTETDLTPWSAPEGDDAFPSSSFQTDARARRRRLPRL